MIVDYIDEHNDKFGDDPICRVLTEHGLQIAPSTYCAANQRGISDATWADAHNANALFDLWRSNRCLYGVRKLWHTARRAGHDIGRDQVARLMRLTGIDGIVCGRRTTKTTEPGPATAPRHPDLIGRAWSSGSVVGRRFHLLLDSGRVLLHRVLCGRVFAADPGLAGDVGEDDTVGDLGARTSAVHPT